MYGWDLRDEERRLINNIGRREISVEERGKERKKETRVRISSLEFLLLRGLNPNPNSPPMMGK